METSQEHRGRKVETLTDVIRLLDSINDGLDSGKLSAEHARIKLGVSKQYISVANLVMQHRRMENGKRPSKDLVLVAGPEEPPKCVKCGTTVTGVQFCPSCGTPTEKNAETALAK